MVSPLLIAMDGRSLRMQRTGVGTYTANLLEQLLLLDDALRIDLYVEEPPSPLNYRGSGRVRVVCCKALLRNNFFWSNRSVPAALKKQPADLFHSPGYTLPLRLRIPAVVSVHDVSYEAEPRWYPYKHGRVRRFWYRMSALRADRIITISEFSNREILRVYGVAPEKVRMIYPGVDGRIFRPITPHDGIEGFKQRYGIHTGFLLFVGDIHPRRNLERVVEAFALAKDSMPEGNKPELIVIGRFIDPAVKDRIGRLQQRISGVRFLGYVPETDLPLFYKTAGAFIFTSFYEGFGLGVLEAMACGCPVIVARGTACEEAAGAAAVAVDPWDARAAAQAISTVFTKPEFALRCSESGLKRAAQFSWSSAAERTLDVYREIAARSKL